MKMLVAISLAVVALSIGGCGSSEETQLPTQPKKTREAVTTAKEEPPAKQPREVHKGSWALLKQAAGHTANRLLLPQGPAPEKVLIRDLKIGEGPMVRRGDSITVIYKGFNYVTGRQTLEQWTDAPFSWTYGLGELFYGLEPGLKQMRVGGVRELIAPSRLTHRTGAIVLYVSLRKAQPQ